MIEPSRFSLWLRCFSAAVLCTVVVGMSALHAQQPAGAGAAARSNPAVATDGATLIHGNYCGAGNRPGKPPIDALDLACMNHDACSPTGGLPTCECNARLREEAAAVAQDPRQAPELRSLASLTSAAATVMLCNPTITDAAVAPAVRAPAAAPPAAVSAAEAPPAARPPVAVPSAAVSAAPAADVPATTAPLSIVPATVAPAVEAPPVAVAPPVTEAAAPSTAEPRARSLP